MVDIKCVDLTKKYKDTVAVDNLNLEIYRGELFSLLGVNGAGKSTTVKMLSCITKPTSGDAYIGGSSIISDDIKVKSQIGMSPQQTAVAPNLSVKENLELICGIHKFTKERTKEKIAELSEKFSLAPVLSKKAGKLSGGWQRKVSIAMSLVCEPSVLFLDEPTQGLDVIAKSELWDMIRSLKGNTTIVLTTHNMKEAEELSDRVGIMRGGKLLVVATAEQIIKMTSSKSFEDAFVKIVKEG